jgi:hypothetical protein
MNFEHTLHGWGGHEYIRVSKACYENFMRYFKEKLESNDFMGWYDSYDWSLNPGFDYKNSTENERWEHLNKCMVARQYFASPVPEYFIRTDYCDIKSIPYVPKPRKKRLTKMEKQIHDDLADAFDLFQTEVKSHGTK